MISVALIGPDGSGKTTICHQLIHSLSVPSRYVYMGVNLGSSNVLLPTSRLIVSIRKLLGHESKNSVRTGDRPVQKQPKGIVRRFGRVLRSYVRLANLLSEESFRHCLVWYYQRRGKVVLLDRWFFADYHAYEAKKEQKEPLSTRIHHAMLRKVYPQPDLVIYLEAPASVLFARKGEGTIESLEQSGQKYLRLRELVKPFFVVNANQPTQDVVSDVTGLILDFYKTKPREGEQQ